MWLHFTHLFWRIMHGMPLLVSSNWASWGLLVAVFFLSEGLAIAFRGWQDMTTRWKQNVGIGLLAAACGYLILFSWSAIVTTYDEHHDSTGRWKVVVEEKNNLKTGLGERDNYIKELEVKSHSKYPNHCWINSQAQPPNPAAPQAKSSTALLIFCNYALDSPTIEVAFDKEFTDGWMGIFGESSTLANTTTKGRVFSSTVSTPRKLPAGKASMINVQGTTGQSPRPLSYAIK
jgi:hypothetical protein